MIGIHVTLKNEAAFESGCVTSKAGISGTSVTQEWKPGHSAATANHSSHVSNVHRLEFHHQVFHPQFASQNQSQHRVLTNISRSALCEQNNK